MRVVKEHQVRRTEILDTAEALFITKGYEKTTINDILKANDIAKGTFYHYFKSKEEVLDEVVMRTVAAGVAKAAAAAADQSLTIHEKFAAILMAQKVYNEEGGDALIEGVHHDDNALMHQKSLVGIIRHLAPVMGTVLAEGIEAGDFNVEYPTETVECLLTAATFLLDEGLFGWSKEEMMLKIKAFINLMEISLGAQKGSFAYLADIIGG